MKSPLCTMTLATLLLAGAACAQSGKEAEKQSGAQPGAQSGAQSDEQPGEKSELEQADDAYRAMDYKTARQIWQSEAEAGSFEAQYRLGVLFEIG